MAEDEKTYALQIYPRKDMTEEEREDLRHALLEAYPASIDAICHVTICPTVALAYKER